MSIKITVLKNGQQLISDMKELVAEDEDKFKHTCLIILTLMILMKKSL